MGTPILLCALLLAPSQAPTGAYARPELLIEASELAKPDVAKKFRIIDVRPRKDLKTGWIPFSLSIEPDWTKMFLSEKKQPWWEDELGLLGIDIDTPVVVYGDDLREAARAWWIMRYWGIKDVRLLNGGWTAWKDGKHPVDTVGYDKPFYSPKDCKLTPAEKRLATKDQLKDSLKDKLLQIIDARSDGEYCGDVKNAKRSGAIPGAIHLEWKELLDPKTQKFKSASELEKVFKDTGIDLKKPSAAHCQSGGRASVMVFAMELMGASDVRNYYLSWAEWGNADDTPIVIPPKK